MPILEARTVSKRFSGLRALEGVDLSVEEGSVHAIIGPNGAGKSTLLSIVSRLMPMDTGKVLIDGLDVSRTAGDVLARRLSIMRQDNHVTARLSVRDLTIDVGVGNPGASALGFFASNQGSVQRVTLRAGDGSGSAGLDLDLGDNGPLSVFDVHISGFDTGIRIKYGSGFTIEHVVMEKIRRVGISSEHSPVFLRRVRYQGDGPLLTDAWNSTTVLFDATIARLRAIDSIPSVTTKDGKLKYATMTPLKAPMISATATAAPMPT